MLLPTASNATTAAVRSPSPPTASTWATGLPTFAPCTSSSFIHFENCGARHVAIEYQNLGMAKKKVNRQVGEVTAVIVGAAIHAGASVEQS